MRKVKNLTSCLGNPDNIVGKIDQRATSIQRSSPLYFRNNVGFILFLSLGIIQLSCSDAANDESFSSEAYDESFSSATYAEPLSSDVYDELFTPEPNTDSFISSPFWSTGSCPVTDTQSSNLEELLQQVSGELVAPQNNSSSLTNQPAHFCSVKLSYVQIQASYLLTQFQLLKQDAQMFANVAKGLELYLSEFNKLVESTKITHLQPLSDSSNNFNTNLAALQQQVNSLFSQLKEMHGQENERVVKLCATHIRNGDADAAYQIFSNRNDNTLLDKIIRRSYNQKRNPDNVEEIVAFASLLPNCSQDAIVYSALFDEMRKYGNLNKPEILLIHEATDPCNVLLFKLRYPLYANVESVVDKWADEIRNNMTDAVNEFAAKGNFSKSAVGSILRKLVETAFQNDFDNFESVLNFAASLSDFSLSATAFDALLGKMKRMDKFYSYEIVRLAYKIKEKMQIGAHSFTPKIERQFKKLKESLPENVAEITWSGQNCTLRNQGNSFEYLYAGNVFVNSDSKNRKIFTWTSTGKPDHSLWAFEEQGGGGKLFRIKNEHFNEYMRTGDMYDSIAKRAFVSDDGASVKEGLWRIKPLNSVTLVIVNELHDDCLFASLYGHGDGANTRGVFTWKDGKKDNFNEKPLCRWSVSC